MLFSYFAKLLVWKKGCWFRNDLHLLCICWFSSTKIEREDHILISPRLLFLAESLTLSIILNKMWVLDMVSIVSLSSKKDPTFSKVQNTFCWNQTINKLSIVFLSALPFCLVSRASSTRNNCTFWFSSAFKLQRSCWAPKLCGPTGPCRTRRSLGQLLE